MTRRTARASLPAGSRPATFDELAKDVSEYADAQSKIGHWYVDAHDRARSRHAWEFGDNDAARSSRSPSRRDRRRPPANAVLDRMLARGDVGGASTGTRLQQYATPERGAGA